MMMWLMRILVLMILIMLKETPSSATDGVDIITYFELYSKVRNASRLF